jgi:hypothetical protein
MMWGIGIVTLVSVIMDMRLMKNTKWNHLILSDGFHVSSIAILFFSFAVGFWVMTKTFHGSGGELFVGSNNVFDFSHAVSVVRSFSWGNNIPFMSPFRAGLPLFYHFFFYFYMAIWEYFGVPILWAINIPSVLSFSALLIVVYYIPQILFKQKKIAGWFAVILTITNSSLAFWNILLSSGISKETLTYIWRLPTYPFAGPFDGSTISLFMTLNNYVNQRHLAFAIALGLFVITLAQKMIIEKQVKMRTSFIIGILCGLLFFWNMAVCLMSGIVIVFLLTLEKKWKDITAFVVPYGTSIVLFMIPYVAVLGDIKALVTGLFSVTAPSVYTQATWTIGNYLWQNLGILPIIAAIGFMVIPKKMSKVFIPYIALFIGLCVYAGFGKHGFDQKFLSFLIITINLLAAIGLTWIWNQKKYLGKTIAIILFIILTISGIVDLMPIKNEFAYPLVSKENSPVIQWIAQNTSKDAVFVSYADMIDPVVFAGRKNYFGFFGNVGLTDRSRIVQLVYDGDKDAASDAHINYVLVPKFEKNDFPYKINIEAISTASARVYEDSKFSIYAIYK